MRDPRSTTTPARPTFGAADVRPARRGAAAPELLGPLAQLRSAVTHHVCGRRADGVPLERVLAELSGLVERAELLEGSPDELGVLLGQVRRWSLDAYYDEPALQNAPRFY